MDFYEYDADVYSDPGFPVFFSFSELRGRQADDSLSWQEDIGLHWHEAIELLYCLEGSGTAVSDTRHIRLSAGELAVINSRRLHSFYTDEFCRYCYLLVGPSLWNSHGLPDRPVQAYLSDPEVCRQMDGLLRELQGQPPFFQAEVCARLTQLSVFLHRNYPEETETPEENAPGKRLEMVKEAVAYVRRHFTEPISVDDVCAAVSFSRSYVCHSFKEVTGQTLLEYIHFVRCHYARTLLASGRYTVSECAEQSGFNNLSYFSRVYKKQMGAPPSATKPLPSAGRDDSACRKIHA